MKKGQTLLFTLHLFVGIGALAGGSAAIVNPQEPLGVPLYLLENSPFTDYLIPGLVLFILIGLGNVMGAIMMHRLKAKHQGYISLLLSLALVFWIVVQCIILNTITFLHVLFFAIGVVKGALARSLFFYI